MKIAILGTGLMGKEVAKDLIRSSKVKFIGLADIDFAKAEQVCKQIDSEKIKPFQVDASNEKELTSFMRSYDVVVNALFYSFNERVAKAAIEVGVHSVDLGGHIGQMTEKVIALHEEAKEANVTLIPDLGVAPGMINILAGYGASKLAEVESIKLYVGGIPLRPDPPLGYNHVFSMEGVFDHYTEQSLIIRNGKKMTVPSLSEVEEIYFEKFGPLEAFHTSGGTSTLPESFPTVNTLEYKTIRYKGHSEKFKLLVDLNLTRNNYVVEVNGQKVKPRDVLLNVLDPFVQLKDKDDAVLLRVIVSGNRSGEEKTYEYEMITYKDREKNVTAMARATAYTVSVVAQMIGDGTIEKKGVYPPEKIIPGKQYIEQMAERDVVISERMKKYVNK